MLQFRKEIYVSSRKEGETRIAIVENGRLAELFVENQETVRHVGEIFLGKVAKVIPGMNAAFIDVGLGQDAFLHFSDVGESFDGSMAYLADADMRDDDDDEEDEEFDDDDRDDTGDRPQLVRKANRPSPVRKPFSTLEVSNINLQPGQSILVQVTREAFANKGVRVTSRISLPGRFVVLVPFEPGIGISKKVYSVRERRRLRRIVRSLKPREMGIIIRTVAENKEESALREDIQKLLDQWNDIQTKIKDAQPPLLVYQDKDITTGVLRDLFTYDITKIIVDEKKMYREVLDYVQWASPNLAGHVELYKDSNPMFVARGIEEQIEQTMSRKVPLPSGGYLFIEKTEAMVIVDVNSGRYAARREQELNSLKTNLESARETARQLRLRDIGGIIIVDFIDMVDDRNKKKVYDEMKKEMRKDRAKSSILPLTEFGLMQITRQRIRQSIGDTLSDECPACGGTGMLISETTVIHQIERWMDNYRKESDRTPVTLRVHPMLRDKLTAGFLFSPFRKMKTRYKVKATLETDHSLRADEFRFIGNKGDITPEYLAQRAPADLLEEKAAAAPALRNPERREGGRPPRSGGGRDGGGRDAGGRDGGDGGGREGGGGQNRRPHRRRPQRPGGSGQRRERPVGDKQRERTQ